MKKTAKKLIICALAALTLASSAAVTSFAAEPAAPSAVSANAKADGEETITPYADTIVWKYQVIDGVLYKRRWNQTKGVWVDPYWIKA